MFIGQRKYLVAIAYEHVAHQLLEVQIGRIVDESIPLLREPIGVEVQSAQGCAGCFRQQGEPAIAQFSRDGGQHQQRVGQIRSRQAHASGAGPVAISLLHCRQAQCVNHRGMVGQVEHRSGDTGHRGVRQVLERIDDRCLQAFLERQAAFQHLPNAISFQCPAWLQCRVCTQHVLEFIEARRCKPRVLQISDVGELRRTVGHDRVVKAIDLHGLCGQRFCLASPVSPQGWRKIQGRGVAHAQIGGQCFGVG
ncbi:hypothetical protein D3C73_612330 [compost metagenome]